MISVLTSRRSRPRWELVTVFAAWDSKAVKDDPAAERQRMYDIDSAFGHIAKAIFDYYAVSK